MNHELLLLCMRSSLPLLHNYSEIDGIVFSDKKKIDWFLNGISHDDFDTNVMFFQLFPLPTVFVNVYSFVYVLFNRHV